MVSRKLVHLGLWDMKLDKTMTDYIPILCAKRCILNVLFPGESCIIYKCVQTGILNCDTIFPTLFILVETKCDLRGDRDLTEEVDSLLIAKGFSYNEEMGAVKECTYYAQISHRGTSRWCLMELLEQFSAHFLSRRWRISVCHLREGKINKSGSLIVNSLNKNKRC